MKRREITLEDITNNDKYEFGSMQSWLIYILIWRERQKSHKTDQSGFSLMRRILEVSAPRRNVQSFSYSGLFSFYVETFWTKWRGCWSWQCNRSILTNLSEVDFCFCRQNHTQNRDERFWKPTEFKFIGLAVSKIFDCIIITIIAIIRY
jgi:hypothetical protein